MDEETTFSTAELSARCSVEPRTIQRWAKAGMPKISKGLFPVGALFWIIEHQQSEMRRLKLDASFVEYKRRKMAADCAMSEEKLATYRGENVPIDDIEDALSQASTVIKAKLRSLSRIARWLHGQSVSEIGRVLKIKGNEVLEALSAVKLRRSRRRNPNQ